ncbi:MAG: hypothetical protein V3V01_07305 [Acidimicrobiales bacterium]
MTRNQVEVLQIRGIDVKLGDVVHARATELSGWFVVAKVEVLPSGMITITDEAEIGGFLAEPLGLVGLQIMQPIVGESQPPKEGDGPPKVGTQLEERRVAAEAQREVDDAAAAAKSVADEAAATAEEQTAPASGLFAKPAA